jgi:hypothetical protein
LKGATLPFQSSVERGSDNYPFQARRPSVAVEMTEPPLFKQWAPVKRAMMISVSKQRAAVKWQPFPSNVLAIATLSSKGLSALKALDNAAVKRAMATTLFKKRSR